MPVLEVATPDAFERDVLRSAQPTVVAFWAAWCPYCRIFRRVFDARAARSGVRFALVHIEEDDNPLWDRYNIEVVPSVAYFVAGRLEKRLDGALRRGVSEREFEAFLRDVLPAEPSASPSLPG